MSKKIILTIIGLGVVVGLGFLAVKYTNNNRNNNAKEENTEVRVPASQAPTENPKPTENFSEFGKLITIQLNDKITFSDGLKVAVTAIEDSRCPQKVQCIWAGEIAPVLEVSGGKISDPGEVHLGTMNNKSASVEGYTFSLKNATATTATIEVVKN